MSHHHLLSSSLPSSSSSLSSPPPLLPLSSWPLPRCFHHASRSRYRPLFLLCLPYNGAGSRVMLALAPDLMQSLIARFSRMIAYLDRSKRVRLISLTSPYLRNHLKVPVDTHRAPPIFTSVLVCAVPRTEAWSSLCIWKMPVALFMWCQSPVRGPDFLRFAQDYYARWKMSVSKKRTLWLK
jgi:hypothetical protein